jgi:hypothetical protein
VYCVLNVMFSFTGPIYNAVFAHKCSRTYALSLVDQVSISRSERKKGITSHQTIKSDIEMSCPRRIGCSRYFYV